MFVGLYFQRFLELCPTADCCWVVVALTDLFAQVAGLGSTHTGKTAKRAKVALAWEVVTTLKGL